MDLELFQILKSVAEVESDPHLRSKRYVVAEKGSEIRKETRIADHAIKEKNTRLDSAFTALTVTELLMSYSRLIRNQMQLALALTLSRIRRKSIMSIMPITPSAVHFRKIRIHPVLVKTMKPRPSIRIKYIVTHPMPKLSIVPKMSAKFPEP